MGVYHLLVQSFPIVLWYTAFLFILLRAVSDGSFAQGLSMAITPLLLLGVLSGIVAYVLGFLVWPLGAVTSSPLGRNHILLASWTLVIWTVLWVLIWRAGDDAWRGWNRWLLPTLSGLGVGLLTITGTLGGSTAHNPSVVSDVVRFVLGWEIYTTLYVPNATLALSLVASVTLVGLGIWGRRHNV